MPKMLLDKHDEKVGNRRMIFKPYHSSSLANLYTIESLSGQRLMVECGLVYRRIQSSLNYDLSNIQGCILSHEHLDHSKGVKNIIRSGIPVYTSEGTVEGLKLTAPYRNRVAKITALNIFKVGDFKVMAFNTIHDCNQPYGYVVYCDGEYLLFATDTFYIPVSFKFPFSIVAVEASYDKELLQHRIEGGYVPEAVGKRLLTSHQNIKIASKYIKNFCDLSICREIHLIHVSRGNQETDKTKGYFEKNYSPKIFINDERYINARRI